MADITMSLDDTLELDAVIKEWNDPNNIVEDSNDKFNMSGFYTGTRVLDPQESGTHTIKVNGQELTVKVTDTSTIPDSGVFDNTILQWYAGAGINVSDGQQTNGWYDQISSTTATDVGDPIYRADQSGFEAVDYDGVNGGHDIPS